jgi:hypothetical protein
LPRFEYMKRLLSRFPEEKVDKYNLGALAVDGWVHIEIRKGMYGLKHAGLLANQLPTSFCKLVWHHLDITRHATRLDYGCTKRGQSLSPS